jgi:hypothetical protein
VTGRTCGGPHPYPEPGHPHPEGSRCYCAACERAGHRWAWGLAAACQEVGQSGLCRRGHPVADLADTVAGRLYTAGSEPHDPALTAVRAWNGSVTSRRATEVPAGGYGSMGATFAPPGGHQTGEKNSAPAPLRAESASTQTTESDWDLVALALASGATGPSHQPEPSWPRPSSTSNTGADDNTRTSG